MEKELKFDQKSLLDLKQVTDKFNQENFEKDLVAYKKDYDKLSIIYPEKNKKLFLEIKIEDSYSASMVYEWLYGKSKYDNKPLRLFGSSLEIIHFEKPSGFSDGEKYAIKTLYEKVFGY